MGIIISGFSAVGKSKFATDCKNLKVLDLDSNEFSRFSNGEKKPNFPENYLKVIKEKLPQFDYVLVSTQPEVIDRLITNGLPFIIVAPKIDLKNEFISRYKKRRSPKAFIEFIDKNWDNFINQIQSYKHIHKIYLKSGEYLSDKINEIGKIFNQFTIALTPNDLYAQHTAVCITSIKSNKKKDEFIKIYIITNDFSAENKQKILSLSAGDVQIEFKSISDSLFRDFYLRSRFPINVFYRLYLCYLFPEYKKIIYLDVDMLVMKSLSPFWRTNLKNFAIAGVKARNYKVCLERLEIRKNGKYVNAGALLMNLDFWRKNKLFEKCSKFLIENKPLYLDQDALNIVMQNQIKYVSSVWNTSSFPEVLTAPGGYPQMFKALDNPSIVHLITSQKPWNPTTNGHLHRKEYFKYLRMTPYKSYFYKYLFNRYIFFFSFKNEKIFLRILGLNILYFLRGITYLFGFPICGEVDENWKRLNKQKVIKK
ncbi:MAG: glycosyltransferase family 8 protein [Alphaproteobacteria bacterium]|nr:glycosyltransferase family 8 protein [Alphaproteobacteria bacterium]